MRLTHFSGMTWEQAEDALVDNLSLLALSDDPLSRECAIAIRDHGSEAGTAILCAYLFLDANGGVRTAQHGINIYKDILAIREKEGHDVSMSKDRVMEMDHWMAWVGTEGPHSKKIKWPIEFPFRNHDKRAGLANIMLLIAAKELPDGSNTRMIAANAIITFLREGMERKKAHEQADDT